MRTSQSETAPISPAESDSPAGSDPLAATIRQNLARIKDRISAAAVASGRRAADVTLLAVSKTRTPLAVEAALAAGQLHFGENRVQEASSKFPPLRPAHPGLTLHLIGPLQTNKARLAVRLADVIESLDRPNLADAIAAAIEKEGRTPRLLVEVNVAGEAQKSGIAAHLADAFIDTCQQRFGAALEGLMCIPPAGENPDPHFAWLARCARRHGLGLLSMGMSADFEAAIAAGATEVRIGIAIFGPR
ncbi:MAG: YggS family pyridoxal phosphate-dependent enzyme [Acetobacteraceae bacterium]